MIYKIFLLKSCFRDGMRADRTCQKQHQTDKHDLKSNHRESFIDQESDAAQNDTRSASDAGNLQIGQKIFLLYGTDHRYGCKKNAERYKQKWSKFL